MAPIFHGTKFATVLFFLTILTSQIAVDLAREVTNEDIRDALLSVVHMIRQTEDKLERHELREKQLGEIVKKALTGLDKRHRALDPLKGMLSRLDERLAGVETVLIQSEERNRQNSKATKDTIEELRQVIDRVNTSTNPPSSGNSESSLLPIISSQLKDLQTSISEMSSKLNELNKVQVDELDEKSTNVLKTLAEKSIAVAEIIEKYESKFENLSSKNVATEVGSISYQEPDANQNSVLKAIDGQKVLLETLTNIIQSAESKLSQIPALADIETLTNTTLESLQEMQYDIKINNNRTFNKVNEKLVTIENAISQNHEESSKSTSDLIVMSDTMSSGVIKSYEQLRTEIQALNKVEKVMIQTADNVLDTKRRIEYGVHQILLEVGDLVKLQSKELNGTINQRFDDIELTILDNQTGALANLTTKLETEMSQVWRQIGIMYQQLTASNTALDRLQAQTETYVNGSLTTMDSMEGKVGQITGRMSEVDENLNYLLGRLSLVTQEFNQIKTGLGSALDQIRSSFLEVQNRVKDVKGPGPHKISESEDTNVSDTGDKV